MAKSKSDLEDLVKDLSDIGQVYKLWNEPDSDSAYMSFSNLNSTRAKPEPGFVFVPENLGGSDLNGGTVTRSNYEAFVKEFGDEPGVYELHGDYNSYGIAVRLDSITDAMMETFNALASYPVLDDEAHSKLQTEAQQASWDGFYEREFKKMLAKELVAGFEKGIDVEDEVEEVVDELTSDQLWELFDDARDAANEYWEEQSDGEMSINLKRVFKKLDLEPLLDLVQARLPADEEEDAAPPVDPRQLKLAGVSERKRMKGKQDAYQRYVFSVETRDKKGWWHDTGSDVWVLVTRYGDVSREWTDTVGSDLVAQYAPDEKPGRFSVHRSGSGINPFLLSTSRGRPILKLVPDAESPLWRDGETSINLGVKESRKKRGIGPGTVDNFLMVLSSMLTQYDMQQSRSKYHNVYALGHYLEAKHNIEDQVASIKDESDAASLAELRSAMNQKFNPGFPPVVKVEKQIAAWLATGKEPSLIG